MNADEIRKLSDKDLLGEIDDTRREMYMLRLQKATGELKDTNLPTRNRRKLARLLTVLTQRHQTAQTSEGK